MTSDIIVIASAHTTDHRLYTRFNMTVEKFCFPWMIIGMDQPLDYPSNDPRLFVAGCPRMLRLLASMTQPYVILTDSFDVLCCRPWQSGEVAAAIENSRGQLLVSVEANCFPDGPWRAQYDAECQTPWRYGNAGQFGGRRESVIAFLEALLEGTRKMTEEYNPFGGSCQTVLHELYTAGYPMRLDTGCNVFQSLYTDAARHILMQDYYWKDGLGIERQKPEVWNRLTGSHPFFLHYNGKAPGYQEMYERLMR